MRPLMVFTELERRASWRALAGLDDVLHRSGAAGGSAAVEAAYTGVVRALIEEGWPDPGVAVASVLLESENAVAGTPRPPAGLRASALADLEVVTEALRRDWHADAERAVAGALPPLAELATPAGADPWHASVSSLATVLRCGRAEAVLDELLERYRRDGCGAPARYPALRWESGELRGIAHPAVADAEALVGVDDQLRRLHLNTEALLAGAPSHNVLLYGPRGSGKSTAVRGLLPRYGERGLRLVELAGDDLERLPEVVERLRLRPQRFVLYVDDLSFEQGDRRYHPLKTLLEGSLTARPGNVVLYATSNRRHLLRERLSDRPEPDEDDDVHAWDTHNERLALADRFGLTLTFPSAGQRDYLAIVDALARDAGVHGPDLHERAVRFADWGNGYSGRTARQFIDALLQERAPLPD